jgi:hypothetical protein
MRRLLATLAFIMSGTAAIAAEPTAFTLFVGGGIAGAGPNFYVSVTRDGTLKIRRTGLPIVKPGQLTASTTSIKLTPRKAKAVLKSANAARDFGEGCRIVSDGTSAQLVLEGSGRSVERNCTSAPSWPNGAKTKLFLKELNSSVPKEFQIF